ncbi:MAG: hypothetical protein JWP79_2690 [Polaromonas sp.]|nr:hypothetical protein [Polaromonas sp.]
MNARETTRAQDYRAPRSVDDVTQQNVRAMRELEQAAMARRTMADCVAGFVATFCGSMTFVWLHVAWFGLWIAGNTLPGVTHVDPFPFTFLTLMVSLEAIFLSAFILISQNYEMRLTERRNQLDLQINLLTEQENTKMLQLLEQIAAKVGIDVSADAELRFLKQVTHPEKLIAQIEQAQQEQPMKSPSA